MNDLERMLADELSAVEDSVPSRPVDTLGLARAGRREQRRRRGIAVAVVAAVVLAVAFGTATTVEVIDRRTDVQPVERPDGEGLYPDRVRERPPTYVEGDQLISGGDAVALDESYNQEGFDSLVVTGDAVVYTVGGTFDSSVGTVKVVRDGVTTDVGQGDDLASDADGYLAAWADVAADRIVVLDTRTLATRDIPVEARAGRSIRLQEIEGGVVYYTDGTGGHRFDLVTGRDEPFDDVVVDAEADVVVTAPRAAIASTDPVDIEMTATTDGRRQVLPDVDAGGSLSPDGRWFATSDPSPETPQRYKNGVDLVDTRTGERRSFDGLVVPGSGLSGVQQEWLDDDTLLVARTNQDGEVRAILTCQVSTMRCTVAVDRPGAGTSFPSSTPFDRTD